MNQPDVTSKDRFLSSRQRYQEIALPEDFSDEEMARDWTLSVVTALSSTARRSAFVSTAPSSCVRCDCTVDFWTMSASSRRRPMRFCDWWPGQ